VRSRGRTPDRRSGRKRNDAHLSTHIDRHERSRDKPRRPTPRPCRRPVAGPPSGDGVPTQLCDTCSLHVSIDDSAELSELGLPGVKDRDRPFRGVSSQRTTNTRSAVTSTARAQSSDESTAPPDSGTEPKSQPSLSERRIYDVNAKSVLSDQGGKEWRRNGLEKSPGLGPPAEQLPRALVLG